MHHEAAYERFVAAGPDGRTRKVEFRKSGFVAAGDQPEIFFFAVDDHGIVVAISGDALKRLQRSGRYLSREEKIDVAGLFLKRRIEAGIELAPENLSLAAPELDQAMRDLGLLS